MVDGCYRRLTDDGFQSVLCVAATGLGKTVIGGYAARRWRGFHRSLGLGERVLVLAHREELLHQWVEAFSKVCPGVRCEIEQAENFASLDAQIVVGSVATLCGKHRLERFARDHFGLVMVDEAHHYVRKNRTYHCIVSWFERAKRIGLTATPDRSDERALGQCFDAALETVYDYKWGQDNGWLVPVVAEMVQIAGLDFRVLGDGDGDFADGDGSPLASLMKQEGPLQGVVAAAIERATAKNAWHTEGARPTLVFAASVEHAVRMSEIFNRHHLERQTGRAAVVYSQAKGLPPMKREERRAILDAFRRGYYSYLCNYGVLTEGTDLPNVRVVVPARITKSRALFAQMIGRGGRPHGEIVPRLNAAASAEERRRLIRESPKPGVLVVDPIGISGQHKLCTSLDVLAGVYDDDDVLADAFDAIRKKGGRADVNEELRQARIRKMQQEAARRRHLVASAEFTTRKVDLFDLFDVATGREPGWFKGKPATDNQKAALGRAGVEQEELESLSFFKASEMLNEMARRRTEGLCTLAQARLLTKYGYETKDLTFAEAGRLIDELKRNGWRRPDQPDREAPVEYGDGPF
jgi:superfamily II DNA or RNA helicase